MSDSSAARSGALSGRVVVVTGAAGGIGRALAEAFASQGARVGLLDIDETALAETQRSLETSGASVLARPCDLRDAQACQEAMAAIVAEWGGVDVLVNNAGLSHHGLFEDTDPEVLRQVMDVNFFGSLNATRAALPHITARRGSIVVISSVAGFAPLVARTGYAASKHALEGFFASLRCELAGRGVHVLVVCPSYTDTAIDAHALTATGSSGGGLGKSMVGRVAKPADVAEAIVEATLRRRRRLVLGAVGKSAYFLSRVLPRAYERLMCSSHRADLEPRRS